jgi:hypothetical protein
MSIYRPEAYRLWLTGDERADFCKWELGRESRVCRLVAVGTRCVG